ncbi:MAG: cation diffusion facilitator family transporter [Actinomycetota bacterium]
MSVSPRFEFPSRKRNVYERAIKLEWITIAYLITAIIAIYLTLGSSQAMKTAWFEDMLSLIPPLAFLVANRIRSRIPDSNHPYGWHRSISIGYLVAALALAGMGSFLLFDAVMKLATFEHPSIGTVSLFGHQIWLGWLMIPAAAYSGLPAMLIGRMKLPLANELHDKVLFADAKMNKADWLTAVAAILGVLGIAWGLWWADAVAASVISLDIIRDGVTNLRASVSDLMDSAPTVVDGSSVDPLPARMETEMKKLSWVRDARVRMREDGHVYFGEIFVIPTSDEKLTENIDDAAAHLASLDWRLNDVTIMPVTQFEEHPGENV